MAGRSQSAAEGLAAVTANLDRELAGIETRSRAGLLAAGHLVIGRSNPKVPREYSNLVASQYVRKAQGDPNAVELGYEANYAAYVHENVEMKLAGQKRPSGKGQYWGPDGEAKFLENAIGRSHRDILDTVASYADVGSDQ